MTRELLEIVSWNREIAASLRVFVKYFPAHETGNLKKVVGISGKGFPIETPNGRGQMATEDRKL